MPDPATEIIAKAIAGGRLSPAEGLALLESNDLAALGQAADAVTRPPAPGTVPHLQRRSKHQLHERLH